MKTNVEIKMVKVLSEGTVTNLCLFEESFDYWGKRRTVTFVKEVPRTRDEVINAFQDLIEDIEF